MLSILPNDKMTCAFYFIVFDILFHIERKIIFFIFFIYTILKGLIESTVYEPISYPYISEQKVYPEATFKICQSKKYFREQIWPDRAVNIYFYRQTWQAFDNSWTSNDSILTSSL